jgi:3-methyl-2-oxobutanoate hydroxymethyltransferase
MFQPIQGARFTVRDFQAAKTRGEKWAMLTAYDSWSTRLFEEAGIPALLVGDSAAMVMFGHENTIPVDVDDLLPLVKAVVRSSKHAFVIADLPFGTYQESNEQAIATSVRFIKEGGAHAVKLEGGAHVLPQVKALVANGIPVMAHLGLTPQSVNQFGGYVVQGKGEAGALLIQDAIELEKAGAFAIVLEVVPTELAAELTAKVKIPVIGIGAGNQTDAQVLVWQDLVGALSGHTPKFVQPYADLKGMVTQAVSKWASDVQSGAYPDDSHSYHR